MFTGIVEELGTIKAIKTGAKSIQITVAAKKILADLAIGDSIAVNGACLTVVRFGGSDFTADVMPETMRLTGLAYLNIGAAVNLERALTLSSRLGGHIVSGHIDGMGEILETVRDDNAVIVKIKAAATLLKYMIKKGSVTIDGVSLTIVTVEKTWFSVSMIPHTASVTTLGLKKAGDFVNIENDIIGKYVERLLNCQDEQNSQTASTKITKDFLSQYGF